jgi:hypothetical protein
MTRASVIAASALLVLGFSVLPAHAAGNLLANGDAESAPGSASGAVVAVPGWALGAGSQFTAVTYNPTFGGPNVGSPGPADRGLNYFAGGPSAALSTASQLIDLSAFLGAIASGQATFSLSGWFGGYQSQDDHAILNVSLLDANGIQTGFGAVGDVSRADRNNVTGLLFRDLAASIAPTTTQALVSISLVRQQGSYDDGYADNLSFSVSSVPEPGSVAMLLAGLLGVGAASRRARRD